MSNVKTGFSFYPMDASRFQDLRIKRLKKDCGCAGFAVYEYILNEIYRVRGCVLVWDESTAFDVAEYWGLKESQVNEIVRYCCAVGLFDKELLSNGSVLTSPSIQSRYVEMCIRAKRKEINIPEEYDIIPEESRKIMEEYLKIPKVCRKVYKDIIDTNNINLDSSSSEDKSSPASGNEKGKPRGKKNATKSPTPNTQAKQVFLDYYKSVTGDDYYWDAKAAANMPKLLNKLRYQRQKKSLSNEDKDVIEALDVLLHSISDAWILEHLSVEIVNSKFNELVAQARAEHLNNKRKSNFADYDNSKRYTGF